MSERRVEMSEAEIDAFVGTGDVAALCIRGRDGTLEARMLRYRQAPEGLVLDIGEDEALTDAAGCEALAIVDVFPSPQEIKGALLSGTLKATGRAAGEAGRLLKVVSKTGFDFTKMAMPKG